MCEQYNRPAKIPSKVPCSNVNRLAIRKTQENVFLFLFYFEFNLLKNSYRVKFYFTKILFLTRCISLLRIKLFESCRISKIKFGDLLKHLFHKSVFFSKSERYN